MKTQVRCNTCKFGDWAYKLKPGERLPCGDPCIGFHKWQAKAAPKHPTVELECVCGNKESTFSPHPLTGFVYNSNWSVRCGVCSAKMTEVKNG